MRLVGVFFFFNDTATTEIYTLSLHDALPIFAGAGVVGLHPDPDLGQLAQHLAADHELRVDQDVEVQLAGGQRSEEHTSELQSPCNLVCRLLLEKKKPS